MTYEFKCNACMNLFEEEKSIKDDSPGTCTACGSTDTRRMISLTGFVLKGDGWAKDLYSTRKA